MKLPTLPTMPAPSSTITAAGLAGIGCIFVSELCAQFGVELRPTLVSTGTAFVMAVIGYAKRETRYGWGEPDEHEQGGP